MSHENSVRSRCALRQPDVRHPALPGANHDTAINLHFEHNNYRLDARLAAFGDDVLEHKRHDAHRGRRLTDDDHVNEHHDYAGKLPHASCRQRTLLLPQRTDRYGHRNRPKWSNDVRGRKLTRPRLGRAAAIAFVRICSGALEDRPGAGKAPDRRNKRLFPVKRATRSVKAPTTGR